MVFGQDWVISHSYWVRELGKIKTAKNQSGHFYSIFAPQILKNAPSCLATDLKVSWNSLNPFRVSYIPHSELSHPTSKNQSPDLPRVQCHGHISGMTKL